MRLKLFQDENLKFTVKLFHERAKDIQESIEKILNHEVHPISTFLNYLSNSNNNKIIELLKEIGIMGKIPNKTFNEEDLIRLFYLPKENTPHQALVNLIIEPVDNKEKIRAWFEDHHHAQDKPSESFDLSI